MWSNETALEAELCWESDVNRIARGFFQSPLTSKTDAEECLRYLADYDQQWVSYLLDYHDTDTLDGLAVKMSEQVRYLTAPR